MAISAEFPAQSGSLGLVEMDKLTAGTDLHGFQQLLRGALLKLLSLFWRHSYIIHTSLFI